MSDSCGTMYIARLLSACALGWLPSDELAAVASPLGYESGPSDPRSMSAVSSDVDDGKLP